MLGNKLSRSLTLSIWEHMDPCHCRQPFKSSVIVIWIESASFKRTCKFLPVWWMELYILPYTNTISNCVPDQANWVGFQCKVTVIKAYWKNTDACTDVLQMCEWADWCQRPLFWHLSVTSDDWLECGVTGYIFPQPELKLSCVSGSSTLLCPSVRGHIFCHLIVCAIE